MTRVLTISFDEWFSTFEGLARKQRLTLGSKSEYRDYYEDGDTPTFALVEELNQSKPVHERKKSWTVPRRDSIM